MTKKAITKQELLLQVEQLRLRLEEAEEALRAIRSGEVDALMVYGPKVVAATEALKASEARFRVLTETTSAAIFITQGLRILYANDAAQAITGYSGDELLRMELWELAHPAYRDTLKQRGLAHPWAENIPNRFELKTLTKGGEERWLDITTGNIEYEGRPASVVTAFDITARDRAEKDLQKSKAELEIRVAERTAQLRQVNQALRDEIVERERLLTQVHNYAEELEVANEELSQQAGQLEAQAVALQGAYARLESVLNSITDAYLALDSEWRFLQVNPVAEQKVFGRPASELVGKVIWDEYPQTVQGEGYRQYHLAVEKGQPVHFETPSHIVPGHWFEVHAYPREGGLEVYFRDITERKQAEDEIASLARFPSENPTPVLRLSQAGVVLYVNEASKTLLREWKWVAGDSAPSYWRDLVAEAVASRANRTVDVECGERVYSFFVTPIAEAGYVNLYGQDITERKKREKELYRLNRTLAAHSHSDQALMRATNEAEYMQEVCKIVVEDCGHAMVWIAFAEEDEAKTVRPVAYAGFEEGYLETLHITWADTERGRGPTGTAIRTGQPSFCRNMVTDPKFAPWRTEALRRGYASSLVLPLLDQGRAFGALTIYFREPDPFTEDEIALLSGLADDLAYGIKTLRLRAAHAQAEEALRASEEHYRSLFNGMTEGFALHEIICDEQGEPCDYRFLEINPSFERLTGLKREDVVGRLMSEVLPNDDPYWVKTCGQVALTGQPVHFDNYSPVLKRHYEVFAYRPAPRQFAVLFLDVTERKQMEAALRVTNEELTRFNRAMVGRELRMIELKKEVNELCEQVSQPPRYALDFVNEESDFLDRIGIVAKL